MTTTEQQTAAVQVGDIFSASWGYDQTNVDYYRVVRTTAKTAWIVSIGATSVEGSQGFMSDSVVPNPDVVLCAKCGAPAGDGWMHDLTREPATEWAAKPHEFDATPSKHRISMSHWDSEPTLKVRDFGVWAHRVSRESSTYRSWYA